LKPIYLGVVEYISDVLVIASELLPDPFESVLAVFVSVISPAVGIVRFPGVKQAANVCDYFTDNDCLSSLLGFDTEDIEFHLIAELFGSLIVRNEFALFDHAEVRTDEQFTNP
jgi:hypothetical protein